MEVGWQQPWWMGQRWGSGCGCVALVVRGFSAESSAGKRPAYMDSEQTERKKESVEAGVEEATVRASHSKARIDQSQKNGWIEDRPR